MDGTFPEGFCLRNAGGALWLRGFACDVHRSKDVECTGFSVPVMLFAAVKRGDLFYLFRRQLKTKQIQVLADMVRVG